MATSEIFNVGKTYASVIDVKKEVLEYNRRHYTNFVISSNNKKSLVIQCKNGRGRKSKSTGKRPRQHYNYIGCEACITFYKSQKEGESLKLTKV